MSKFIIVLSVAIFASAIYAVPLEEASETPLLVNSEQCLESINATFVCMTQVLSTLRRFNSEAYREEMSKDDAYKFEKIILKANATKVALVKKISTTPCNKILCSDETGFRVGSLTRLPLDIVTQDSYHYTFSYNDDSTSNETDSDQSVTYNFELKEITKDLIQTTDEILRIGLSEFERLDKPLAPGKVYKLRKIIPQNSINGDVYD